MATLYVVICADDYALTPAVSAAILDLARAGRITAVSCMTTSPLWTELGPALKPLADTVDVGLHLTLVDETPLTPMPRLAPNGRLPSIGQLIAKSYLGQIPQAEVATEIAAQLNAFSDVMDRPPAHIDGHLHAHVLPGIRGAVFAAAERLSPRPWLRSTSDRSGAIYSRPAALKAAFISVLGGAFERTARARGFVINSGFSGFYDFARGDYAHSFPAFLTGARAGHLILCHPGKQDDSSAWATARAKEYDFLRGPAFANLLAHVELVRLRGADETLTVS